MKSQVFFCGNICNLFAGFGKRVLWLMLSVISTFYISTLFLTQNTNAIAKQSTLTMTITDGNPALTLIPSGSGTFGKTGDTTVAIGTDNYSGYTFKIATYNSSSASDGFGNYIQSITPSITESVFRDNSAYNNQWGYKPSQYVTESNGVNTVVPNTQYYLPAPSSQGDTIDKTTTANSTDNTYTVSFASKVDFDTPPGTYTYTYVFQVVANPITFNITYDENTNDTVNGMPSPNPQPVSIAGGTETASSNVTLSNATPTRTGYTFAGWCDEATTFDNVNYNDTCSGNTYQPSATYGVDQTAGENIILYAIWESVSYTISFDTDGGSAVSSITRKHGQPLGTLVESTKTGFTFEGWYIDSGLSQKVSASTLATGFTVLYANWTGLNYACTIATYLHTEQCTRGSSGCYEAGYRTNGSMQTDVITYGRLVNSSTMQLGDAYTCDVNADGNFDEADERFYYIGMNGQNASFIHYKSTQNADLSYSDALADLPSATNDWTNDKLVTFANDKAARLLTYSEAVTNCDNNTANFGYNGRCVYLMEQSNFSTTSRRDGIWLTYENSKYRRIHTSSRQITERTQANTPRAVIEVPLQYVELGSDPTYTINFDPQNNGASQITTVQIPAGDTFANYMPSVSYTGYIFNGWFDAASGGNQITANDYPDHDETYYAHWVQDVTHATVPGDPFTLDTGDSDTIVVSNSSDIESYTFSSLDSTVASVNPTTGVVFGIGAGTTTIVMTGDLSGLTKNISVTVTSTVVPSTFYTVTYDSNGGDAVSPTYALINGPVGVLPTTTKSGYRFFGWYKDDDTFYQEVNSSTIVDSDITYHARFIEDSASFPIVFAQTEECVFNGNNNISGDGCSDYTSHNYIDTGIQLFTTANYSKDFEVGFTINSYSTSGQVLTQHTFVNSKLENSTLQYPGFVFRHHANKSNFEITEKFDGNEATYNDISTTTKRVVIKKQNGIISYSLDDGAFVDFQDISSYSQRFDTTVWFGASVDGNGAAMRPLKASLTDMYVKQGTISGNSP